MWDFEDAYYGYLESKGLAKRLVDRNEYEEFKNKVESNLRNRTTKDGHS